MTPEHQAKPVAANANTLALALAASLCAPTARLDLRLRVRFALVFQQPEGPTWEFNPESGALACVTRSAVTRSVARSMSRYLPPAAPSGPATCKDRAGNALRRPRASGAQIHHDVDLLRAAESRRQCGGNWLVRRAPANGPARCLSAMPVPHCERVPLGSRQKHAWIADSVHQTERAGLTRAHHC